MKRSISDITKKDSLKLALSETFELGDCFFAMFNFIKQF